MASALTTELIQQNLKSVIEKINAIVQRLNLKESPRLVAVGKTFPGELTAACYASGQRHFGENYVQELEDKAKQLAEECPDIKWHYIGRIQLLNREAVKMILDFQSNKIKKICEVSNLWCVETVERQKHCELFQKYMLELDKRLNIFVQVNTSSEPNKGGVEPNQLHPLVEFLLKDCPNLTFKGLMTIGSIDQSHNREKNADFELLRNLRTQLCEKFNIDVTSVELSMGMTNDFELAIEYGSTNVRVGSAIFGARTYH